MFRLLKKRLFVRISMVSLCLAAFFGSLLWVYTFHIIKRDFSDKSELFFKQYVNSLDVSLKNLKNSLNVSSTYNIYTILENYEDYTQYEITDTLSNIMLSNYNMRSVYVVTKDQILGDRHYIMEGVETPGDYYDMLTDSYSETGWYIARANNSNFLFYIESFRDSFIIAVTSPNERMFSYAPVGENVFMKKSDIVMLDDYGNDIGVLINSQTGRRNILKYAKEGQPEKRVGARMIRYEHLEDCGLTLAFALPMADVYFQMFILTIFIACIFALFAFIYVRILKTFTQNLATPLEQLNKNMLDFIELQKGGGENEKSIDS